MRNLLQGADKKKKSTIDAFKQGLSSVSFV